MSNRGARGGPRGGGESRGGRGGRGGPAGGPRGGGGGGGGYGGGGRGGGGGGYRGGGPARGGGPIIFQQDRPATEDQRLATTAQLEGTLKKLPFRAERPYRPGFGTLGTRITLRSNFFPVKVPKGTIFDYSIKISPDPGGRKTRNRIFQLLEASTNQQWRPYVNVVAHDRSARLVSAKKFPQPLDIPITFVDEGRTQPDPRAKVYTVSIEFTRELDMSQINKYTEGGQEYRDYDPLPLISALNLILQYKAAHSGFRVGAGQDKASTASKYFFPTLDRFPLGPGVEAWKGFFVSVRPVYKEMMINVNACMSAFYKPGKLSDAIMEFRRESRGGIPARFTQRLSVTTTHLGYKQRKPVRRILSATARTYKFQCDEYGGGQISVEDYFKRKYKITLRNANDLPVVDISGPNSRNAIIVPAELCEIEPGQMYGKLSDKETASMIRYACRRPIENATSIVNEGFPSLGFTPDTFGDPARAFGLSVVGDMATVPGRELPPPKLSYSGGKPLFAKNGAWNILEVKFHKGADVRSWWVLVVNDQRPVFQGPNDQALTAIWRGFGEKLRKSGVRLQTSPTLIATDQLPPPGSDPGRARAMSMIENKIQSNISKSGKPTYILVLLSGVDKFIYPGIKRLCDVQLGVHTMHMLTDKVLRGWPEDMNKQDQYFSNVALKLNAKLGGVNHLLDAESMRWLTEQKRRIMIVGMDVTHPSPGSMAGTPSIAAVVANVDEQFVQFPASMRIQQSKKEMITDLTEMMVERLVAYQGKNKTLPDRIYLYRDGVSEGQFDSVLVQELPKVQEAFKKVGTGTLAGAKAQAYKPKLTIIVCGKRHHARFYPTDSRHADKNGNTQPGTIVDQGVTTVYDFDFYLQAHAGLQGTVKPTHYTVIYDENKLGANEIQQGTHTYSYLYARATKAVSLVPAAYYADLACERGRCYLNDLLNADEQQSSAGGSTSGAPRRPRNQQEKEAEEQRVFERAERLWGNGVHPDLRGSMFYI
ncbi:Piwi-domain-containing protein [Coniophora puteana RWD-64-598 SS2]|uniref:Piwi-domain-containing protein n=1 Tax=Coniophora puteana (strain RWD-64-598) TaxID=741705 RepID=A0A5M3MFV7_CONPW|nr:Piwi-domain-containing protein [Coniophora puteana RWD-64-598 SS2]EIW78043.1 Piwi-domain-containing protein [Coniophora puteana RWD-64-598 SS2]